MIFKKEKSIKPKLDQFSNKVTETLFSGSQATKEIDSFFEKLRELKKGARPGQEYI